MDEKKIEEELILKAFIRCTNSEFQTLTLQDAHKVFPGYNGENPDFIISKNNKYIGVDLFMLSLNQSNPPVEYSGKTYNNQMHKQSQHPNVFTSIEKAEEYLQKIKNNPRNYPLTKQDDLGDILRERLTQKMKILRNYVTNKNWLLGHATEIFYTGLVENITKDNIETIVRNLIRKILDNFPAESKKVGNIFLFEHNTGNRSYVFAYK